MWNNHRSGKKNEKEKKPQESTPSKAFIAMICRLYGDVYDDRKEDSRIKGLDWEPGTRAKHKSMASFQKELAIIHGIHLSRTKLQKILITGHCWTTKRSREVQWLYKDYTDPAEIGGKGLDSNIAIREIANHLRISTVTVHINLPYGKVVYDLENKSANARRIDKHRAKKGSVCFD